MAKTVEVKDETIERRLAQLETGQNWISAVVRKIMKALSDQFGINIALVAFMLFASVASAADVTKWDIGNSATASGSGIGTCKVTSDGTSATLTVDKLVSTGSAQSVSNLTVTGTLGVTGLTTLTGGLTNTTVTGTLTMAGAKIIAGGSTHTGTTTLTNTTVVGTLTMDGAKIIAGGSTHTGTTTLTNSSVVGTFTMAGAGIITNAVIVESDSFRSGANIGATVVVTNDCVGSTNVMTFVGGILAGNVRTP